MARPGPGRARRGASASRGLIRAAAIGRLQEACCLCPQRLSAVVRDLYRAGDPGARTARARHPDRLAAPPDRSHRSSGARRDRRGPALPSGIFVPGAVACLARLAARPPATGLSPGAARLARRSAARPDPKPGAPVWPGAGARGRVAERSRPSPRPFSAHAGIGRAVRRADLGPRLDGVCSCQGHLDNSRLGETSKARRSALGGDLHSGRPRPSRELGASAGAGRAVLSRARSRTLFIAAAAAARRRRQRPAMPGRAAFGRPGGTEEGLRRPPRGTGAAAGGSRLALCAYRRRQPRRNVAQPGRAGSASRRGSSGAAPWPSPRCSTPIAGPICSCSPPK